MFSVYRTLSFRYLQRRWGRALLIVASIALGVGTLVATRALNATMYTASLASTNPMAGEVDFVISSGEQSISRNMMAEITGIPGVKSVRGCIFKDVYLPGRDRKATIMGLDFARTVEELKGESGKSIFIYPSMERVRNFVRIVVATQKLQTFMGMGADDQHSPAIIGGALDAELPKADFDADQSKLDFNDFTLIVRKSQHDKKEFKLFRVGYLDARGDWAALGGYTILLDLDEAARILGMAEGEVSRLDVALEPGAKRDLVRAELERRVGERANVRTPDEQNESLQSAMSGMQTGFSLCGVAALVVGVFLVYNVLSVTVAERRHEIGILLSVGATRWQVRGLFSGEAAILGLTGSLLGIPLGWGLAKIGLAPMQQILTEIFQTVHAREVELSPVLMLLAVLAGLTTSVAAALVPAWQASRENPAEAVRRVAKAPSLHHLVVQVVISVTMALVGTILILLRSEIPYKLGMYGGLILVLIGALVASPFFAAVCARLFQPFARRFLAIEWRLAADNLVRSPGRTGLVIGALAAGVSLIVQTAGTIRSNRTALREWVQHTFAADLFVAAGGLINPGDSLTLEDGTAEELRKFPEIEAVLPSRKLKVDYGKEFQIYLLAMDAGEDAAMDRKRRGPTPNSDLMQQLHEHPDSVIMSENFAALHHVREGDTITVSNGKRGIRLHVIGQIVDYTWNHGTLIMDRRDYLKYWNDDKANEYDIYLREGTNHAAVKDQINKRFGGQLTARTTTEVQDYIDGMIGRLYGIAYGQQIVVMLVAALGVVTALLISVLHRRRELGLLRAIGASQNQVIYSVLTEACLMGVIGSIIGVAVGIPLQWYVLRVVIFEESGYLFPMHIPWVEGCVIALGALITATLAGLGPAVHAVRMRIPEAIAYE